MEKFLEWIQVKIGLHTKINKPPLVNEGDIWWSSLGENVGTEINGKGKSFKRPVIIFKKISRKFYFVIPASSQMHAGPWYMPYKDGELEVIACLHQARSIDSRRLLNKQGEMNSTDFINLRQRFQELYNPVSYLAETT